MGHQPHLVARAASTACRPGARRVGLREVMGEVHRRAVYRSAPRPPSRTSRPDLPARSHRHRPTAASAAGRDAAAGRSRFGVNEYRLGPLGVATTIPAPGERHRLEVLRELAALRCGRTRKSHRARQGERGARSERALQKAPALHRLHASPSRRVAQSALDEEPLRRRNIKNDVRQMSAGPATFGRSGRVAQRECSLARMAFGASRRRRVER